MDLNSLRPADTTAAAIAEALQRAEAALAEVQRDITAAKQRRDVLLLDGGPGQLSSAEKLLSAGRDLAERIEAMIAQLRTRLAAAQRAEAFAALAAAKAKAEGASARFAHWWGEAESEIRGKVVEGLRLRRAAADASQEWSSRHAAMSHQYLDEVGPLYSPKNSPVFTHSDAPDWFNRLDDALRGTMSREEQRALGV